MASHHFVLMIFFSFTSNHPHVATLSVYLSLLLKIIPRNSFFNQSHKLLVRVGRSPAYLSDMMTSVADLPGRERLRSSSSFRYELPRLKLKFSERSFSFSGPKAWNSLPSNLQELTNTDTFKKLLKTHLFKLAFGELEWLCWCTIGHYRCNWRMKWRNVM